MSAKQEELARKFGIPEHLIMPEPEPLPPPELFPKRIGWVFHKKGGMNILDTMTWDFPPPMKAHAPVTNVHNPAGPSLAIGAQPAGSALHGAGRKLL